MKLESITNQVFWNAFFVNSLCPNGKFNKVCNLVYSRLSNIYIKVQNQLMEPLKDEREVFQGKKNSFIEILANGA